MRHERSFPCSNDQGLCDYLEKAWISGQLDEYADEHFLIKALENRLSSFLGFQQMIYNDPRFIQWFETSTNIIDDSSFNFNFCINLSKRLSLLESVFGKNQIDKFITDQLSAGKGHYDENTFFEAMSEISVLTFYSGRLWDSALYEPPLEIGKIKKNPEARFMKKYSGNRTITVNIEVKCPKFPEVRQGERKIFIPAFLLTEKGRTAVQSECSRHSIPYCSPRVLKLKEFLNSAADKFSTPNADTFNLLYINWSYSDFPSNGFLEAWSLLTNEINGLLTQPAAALSVGVAPDVFDKITAVIVYTEAFEGLMFSDFRYVWQRNGYGPRFRMWVLNDNLRNAEWKDESRILFETTGMNPDYPSSPICLMDYNIKNDSDRTTAGEIGNILKDFALCHAKYFVDA